MKPRVCVIFTGGTISMRFDPAAGGPVPALSPSDILAQIPGLNAIADVHSIDFARWPGPFMTPSGMMKLVSVVKTALTDPSLHGIVITHGTDTLEETAYLLHLLVRSPKPIVLAGSMRNCSELGWDGPSNLTSAIRVAAHPACQNLGVLVVMNDQLLPARDATKTHTESVDTFQARDFGPLGFLDKDRIILARRPILEQPLIVERLEERVEIIKLSAGSNGRLLRLAFEDGARGLIIEGLGRGNVPFPAISEVERISSQGIPVIITSRCPRGRVLDTYAYEGSGKHLKRMGVILGGLLPSHKARLKLMALLGSGAELNAIRGSFEDEKDPETVS